jgi:hypothetical protein
MTYDRTRQMHLHQHHTQTLYNRENSVLKVYMDLICCSDCSPIDFISDTKIQTVTEKKHTATVTDGSDMAQ